MRHRSPVLATLALLISILAAARPASADTLPTYRTSYVPQARILRSSPGPDRLTTAVLTLTAISGTHLGLGFGLVAGPGKMNEAMGITAATAGGVGLLSGVAALILVGVASKRSHLAEVPLRLRPAPLVARDAGGLSLVGTF